MQTAAVAYGRLTPEAREKVDALLKLNPDYQTWVAGVAPRDAGKYAFIRAAVWADDIKLRGTATAIATTPPTASRPART